MDTESRPGVAAQINLGSNYAQPSASYEAIPGGNELDRITSYLGNRNCGAPWTSDEERKAETGQEVGKRTASPRAAEKAMIERSYAIRDGASSIFNAGSSFV
jgi:hypothetical protein